jgi:beta-mannosidase
MFSWADAHPAVSWSVLDHERTPKAAFAAVVEACRPVIVVADRFPDRVAPGDAFGLDVHVVSDLHDALEGAVLSGTLTWNGGEHEWRFAGDIGADTCAHVGTLQIVVPDAPGRLVLDLTLDHPSAAATNRYVTTIA